MHWKVVGTLAVVSAGLAMTGCGGSGSAQPTQATFARQVDAACTRSDHQTKAVFKAAVAMQKAGASMAAIRAKLGSKATAYQAQEHTTLKAIQPPERVRTRYVQWLAARTALETRVNAGGASHAELHALAYKVRRLAVGLGLKACG